jgi:hypothetical protein
MLIFDRHPHLSLPPSRGKRPDKNHANSVRSCRTCGRASNAIFHHSNVPLFQSSNFSESLLQPIQHVRHVVRPIVVTAVDSAAVVWIVINF